MNETISRAPEQSIECDLSSLRHIINKRLEGETPSVDGIGRRAIRSNSGSILLEHMTYAGGIYDVYLIDEGEAYRDGGEYLVDNDIAHLRFDSELRIETAEAWRNDMETGHKQRMIPENAQPGFVSHVLAEVEREFATEDIR